MRHSAVLALSFVWSHWRSLVEHVEADLAGRLYLGKLMPMLIITPFGDARAGRACCSRP